MKRAGTVNAGNFQFHINLFKWCCLSCKSGATKCRTNIDHNLQSVTVHVPENILPVLISRCFFFYQGIEKNACLLIMFLTAVIMFYR